MSLDALDNLGDLVAEVDNENPTPEQRAGQVQEQKEADAAEKGAKEWALIPFTVGKTLAMLAPELGQVYTEQACLEWGGAAHLVAVKYGWTAPAAPEFALAAMSINMAVPTVLVLRHKLQQMREGQEAGMFGKLVLWWKQRRAGKAAAAAGAAKPGAGQAEPQPA